MSGGSATEAVDAADAADADRILPVSETVTAVYDRILAEILSGTRSPGSIVRDVEVARSLGVSRTPVREAILLLRSAGVLEVAASRYTRVAVIDDEAAIQLFQVWVTLFGLVVDELLAARVDMDLEQLEAEHETSRRYGGDRHAFVSASGRFFDLVVSRSRNPHLVRAINSVVHAIRLSLVSRPASEHLEMVLLVQAQLIEAVRSRDVALGRASMAALLVIGASDRE